MPASLASVAVLPFFHRGDAAEACRALEREFASALAAKKSFPVIGPAEALKVLQDRGMLSDYLRFQAEFRRKGSFEHNLIEANAALGVPALLLGEVVAYKVTAEPDGGYAASVGATVVLLDALTNVVWQQSKVETEHFAAAPDLSPLVKRVAASLADALPY